MRHTTKTLRNALALLLVALLYQQTCLAQVDPWERVKLIEDGKKVQVKLLSGVTVNGKMEGWSTDGLSVRQGKNRVVPVAKADIAQVAMVGGMSRGRKALWAGGIVGGGLGGVLVAGCASSGGCDVPLAALFAGSVLLYGGVAAGIAALFPQHREVIYRAGQEPNYALPAEYTVQIVGRAMPVVKSGRAIQIQVLLRDGGGGSIASSRIKLRALDLAPGDGSAALPVRASRSDGEGNYFRYDPTVGGTAGGYIFDLNTKGMTPGDYKLNFKVGSDPTIWTRSFRVE